MIIARPNHSASWRANLLLLVALSIPSLAIAVGFTLLGAWPVLPFAGLELTALGIALYYVNRKLQYRQVITLSEDSVRVDEGFYAPRQSWQFRRQAAALTITPEKHPWEGPELSLHDRDASVTLGNFLGREDCLKLLALLESEFRVQGRSPRIGCEF